MEKYQAEGAAREVTDEELKTLKPRWYLPHHAVWHPRKPVEPRVVFDCASKNKGTSLNDELLRGPENISSLIGVILRFRVDDIAFTADIKRMFHQVHVTPEDREALCYLWWPGGDVSKAAKTHQMLVHIFGAKSSPSVAGYALRRTAKDNANDYLSAAAQLKPFIEDGLLRLGGRLDRSSLNYDARHPYILPKNHPVSELIILHYHGLNGHVGSYHTLAKTRERFWITNGVSYVKRVLKGCHDCRRKNAKLGEEIMAPLPSVRLSSDEIGTAHPFDAVGIDYFGPLYVKLGPKMRSKKNDTLGKRFGCILTCLRYRAVYIEVADDLSTDSFINAVLRFVSRRGALRIIYSDNGTNFQGSEADVLQALKSWDRERIRCSLTRRGVEWVFNSPGASHQGGVWERLIRSTKKILRSLVGQRELNDESLRTFLAEVEKIMNDRPITPVSSDPRDLEALTSNHILLRQNPSTSAGEFNGQDKYDARWKYVQILADSF